VKTESTQREIVEEPDTGMRPVHSAGESPDLAFKEALKSLSAAELQRKKKLTDTYKFREEKLPESGRGPVPSQSENKPVDSADDEFGIKLNTPSARVTEFNRDDIFPSIPEAASETRSGTMNRSEVIQHDPEADLFESTAYEEAADLPDDAVIEIDEELDIPELESETEDPIVAEAVQSDTEAELFQSADFDLEDAVELDDDDGLGLDEEVEEPAAAKNSDSEVKFSGYAFEAEKEARRSLSGMRENQRSESAIMSDERFRMISDDLLVLKNVLSEMKSTISSLQNEIQAMKKDLTSENLEDIKKEQKVMTGSMQDIVSLINELKTRKSWFRF
jgi:hypothetical protein